MRFFRGRTLLHRARSLASRLTWTAAPGRSRARLSGLPVVPISGFDISFRVDPKSGFGRELMQWHERPSELFMLPLLRAALRPGDVFVDVGAHWGLYSIVASRLVGPSGKSVAIEPYLPSFSLLLENAALNGCGNLIPVRAAIGDTVSTGRLRIAAGGDNLNRLVDPSIGTASVRSSRAAQLTRLFRDEATCEVTTLDRIMDAHGTAEAALLKIDIEGGECVMVRDLIRYTERFRAILMEMHPPFTGYDCDVDLLYRCLSRGRRLFVLDQQIRGLASIDSAERFRAALPQYYFLSVRDPMNDLGRESTHWYGFTW